MHIGPKFIEKYFEIKHDFYVKNKVVCRSEPSRFKESPQNSCSEKLLFQIRIGILARCGRIPMDQLQTHQE